MGTIAAHFRVGALDLVIMKSLSDNDTVVLSYGIIVVESTRLT